MPELLKARPTIYKGIQMRSRLEAGFAQWLDKMRLSWEYEPFAVADETGQYLPDFLVRGGAVLVGHTGMVERDAFIEVKPTLGHIDDEKMQQAAVQLKESAGGLLFVQVPEWRPLIFWPTGTGWSQACWGAYHDGQGESCRLLLAAIDLPLGPEWWK